MVSWVRIPFPPKKKKNFMFLIITLIKILVIVVPLLISVAYFTLAERKILGAIQRRRGPNVVGAFGLLQPLSDGFKLLVKETVLPSNANKFIFVISPIITKLSQGAGGGMPGGMPGASVEEVD